MDDTIQLPTKVSSCDYKVILFNIVIFFYRLKTEQIFIFVVFLDGNNKYHDIITTQRDGSY
jgi:hypothetical protein